MLTLKKLMNVKSSKVRQKGNNMRMNDIMNNKGIEINEEHDWNWMNHPAKDGTPRWGRIRKEMKIYSPSDWGTCNATYATVGLEVDTCGDCTNYL